MPHQAKPIPRPCAYPGCAHTVRRKYDKYCTWHKKALKKQKKERKELTRRLLEALSAT